MTAAGVGKFAKDIVNACNNAIRSWQINSKYLQLSLAAVALLLIAILGRTGQDWYLARQAAAAQKDYAQCAQLLHDVQESGAKEGWTQVDRVAKKSYDEHARSTLAPYFKVIESEALEGMGDQAGADASAREAATLVQKGTPFAGPVRLRAILMALDSEDEAVHTQAFEDLKTFAFDQDAVDRDAALYMLGRYHWARAEIEQAADVWRELVRAYQKEDGFSSAWAQHAAQLLEYVS